MQIFIAAIFVLGCTFFGAQAEEQCVFTYPGNGGVFDENMQYKNDSVKVWCDMARFFRPYANENGKQQLTFWDSASRFFDFSMRQGSEEYAFLAITQAADTFRAASPYFRRSDISRFFAKLGTEFPKVLATKDYKQIDDYMIDEMPKFYALACPGRTLNN